MVESRWLGRHLSLVIILFFSASTRATNCFLPNGDIAYGDIPCNSDAVSTCCNGACLANGLCFNPSTNLLSRSSCTDSTWASSACTSICKTINPTTFETVLPCGGGRFCCPTAFDASPDTCCSGTATFTLPSGNVTSNSGIPVAQAVQATGTSRGGTVPSQATTTVTATSTITAVPCSTGGTGSEIDSSTGSTDSTSSGSTPPKTGAATSTVPSATAAAADSNSSSNPLTGANTLTLTRATCNTEIAAVSSTIGGALAGFVLLLSFLLYRSRKHANDSDGEFSPKSTLRRQDSDAHALGAANLKSSPTMTTLASNNPYAKVATTPTTPQVPRRPNTNDLPFTQARDRDSDRSGDLAGAYGRSAPWLQVGNGTSSPTQVRPWVDQTVPPGSPVLVGSRGYI